MKRGILFWILLITTVTVPAVPEERAQGLTVARLDREPAIDGKIEEAVWKQATLIQEFYQTQPGDNTPPSYPTEAMLGYDSKSLLIAIRATDDPKSIRATFARRDDISSDDSVAIYLDTFHDQRKAYVLMFNPLGVQQDGIFSEHGKTDYSIDIVMQSRGTLTASGYSIEIAIPVVNFCAGGLPIPVHRSMPATTKI